jgi:vesicle coat complex subunit
VKKTAITGALKVFYYDPPVIFSNFKLILDDENIISTLSFLIRDNDPLVSVNAVVALN